MDPKIKVWREIRQVAGLRQTDLARRAGLSAARFRTIEGGCVEPSLAEQKAICRVLISEPSAELQRFEDEPSPVTLWVVNREKNEHRAVRLLIRDATSAVGIKLSRGTLHCLTVKVWKGLKAHKLLDLFVSGSRDAVAAAIQMIPRMLKELFREALAEPTPVEPAPRLTGQQRHQAIVKIIRATAREFGIALTDGDAKQVATIVQEKIGSSDLSPEVRNAIACGFKEAIKKRLKADLEEPAGAEPSQGTEVPEAVSR
jgi:transcriptional regulator with XRE-family HTH domain